MSVEEKKPEAKKTDNKDSKSKSTNKVVKRRGRPKGSKNKPTAKKKRGRSSKKSGTGFGEIIAQMKNIKSQIAKLEKEYDKLKSKL